MVTFHLTNLQSKKLTRKQFAQILRLPTSGTLYEVMNDQVIYMFNEMGHQPTFTAINHFKKSNLPCVLSFLFGIVLRCLTGRSFLLDKAKLEVYSVMEGLYYGLNFDYASLYGKNLEFRSLTRSLQLVCQVLNFRD